MGTQTKTILVPVTVEIHDEESSSIPSFHEPFANIGGHSEIEEVTSNMINRTAFHLMSKDKSAAMNFGFRASLIMMPALRAVLDNWGKVTTSDDEVVDLTERT